MLKWGMACCLILSMILLEPCLARKQELVEGQAIFSTIPLSLREKLSARLKLLVEFQRRQQWEELYELLSVLVTQGKEKKEYVRSLQKYYAETPDEALVDFIPRSIIAHKSSAENGWWTIYGCAKFHKKGRDVELHAMVDAYRENGDWYFSQVGVITQIDGGPEPCLYKDGNQIRKVQPMEEKSRPKLGKPATSTTR